MAAHYDFQPLTARAAPAPPPRAEDLQARMAHALAAAEAEADAIRAAAHAEGFAAGRAAALEELRTGVAALGSAVDEMRERALAAGERVEHEAVLLGLDIAERVVGGAIAVEPERVVDVVRGALRATVERERVVVLVNPDDADILRGAVADLLVSPGGIAQLEVHEERRIARGGATVRTLAGEVDAQVATKLDHARALVEAELGS